MIGDTENRATGSATTAQELPLPGMYTGDETWFEAVSLRPPLSFMDQHSTPEQTTNSQVVVML